MDSRSLFQIHRRRVWLAGIVAASLSVSVAAAPPASVETITDGLLRDNALPDIPTLEAAYGSFSATEPAWQRTFRSAPFTSADGYPVAFVEYQRHPSTAGATRMIVLQMAPEACYPVQHLEAAHGPLTSLSFMPAGGKRPPKGWTPPTSLQKDVGDYTAFIDGRKDRPDCLDTLIKRQR
ncbi:hypothetical protein [Stenotrophomonas sp. GZD-301]|uniref:hypothetical protein n=1 Tax=Stenotrophomonas sp. GZD-301 TaxID=3404814 RepID=UPI003BB67976